MRDALGAGEARHLEEPEFGCRRCGRPVTVWDDLCGGCEDNDHDAAEAAAQEREERERQRNLRHD